MSGRSATEAIGYGMPTFHEPGVSCADPPGWIPCSCEPTVQHREFAFGVAELPQDDGGLLSPPRRGLAG